MMRGLIAAVAMTLLLGLSGGFWMGRRILAQAGAISAVATQIMRGDLSQRLPVRDADDEINTLAREINTMLDKIEQLTLGMRTVLDSAAHDLRTPLNRPAVHRRGDDAARRRSVERGSLNESTTEVDRMRSTLDALLRHCHSPGPARWPGTGQSVGMVASVVELLRAGQRRARASYWRVRSLLGRQFWQQAAAGSSAGEFAGHAIQVHRRTAGHPGAVARLGQRNRK